MDQLPFPVLFVAGYIGRLWGCECQLLIMHDNYDDMRNALQRERVCVGTHAIDTLRYPQSLSNTGIFTQRSASLICLTTTSQYCYPHLYPSQPKLI